jgi:hypothetical protein
MAGSEAAIWGDLCDPESEGSSRGSESRHEANRIDREAKTRARDSDRRRVGREVYIGATSIEGLHGWNWPRYNMPPDSKPQGSGMQRFEVGGTLSVPPRKYAEDRALLQFVFREWTTAKWTTATQDFSYVCR